MLLLLFLMYSVFPFSLALFTCSNFLQEPLLNLSKKVFVFPKVNLHFILITDKLKLTGSPLRNDPRV